MSRQNSARLPDNKKGGSSLLSKVMLPMGILALLQVLILVVILIANQVFSYIKGNSYYMIYEKTENRENYIETLFNQKTALVYETAQEIDAITGQILAEQELPGSAIQTDRELDKRILSECAGSLISLIRRNTVNDAFLILDTGTLVDDGESQLRMGLYMRDTDVLENSYADNKDIFMEMGSSKIAQEHGLALDSGWSLYLDVSDRESGSCDFFCVPLETDPGNGDTPLYSRGYWSTLSEISDSQQASVKYSLPLTLEDGTVYGVVGIGIMKKTIQQNLPANDFSNNSASYVLAADLNGNGQYEPMLHSGIVYQGLVQENTVFSEAQPAGYQLWDFTAGEGRRCIGSICIMNLYDSGSPYQGQQWALISAADQDQVLRMYHNLLKAVFAAVLLTLIFGICFSIVTSRRISRPVDQMIETIEASRADNRPVRFCPSGIWEIDLLASSVRDLQADTLSYASRMAHIYSSTVPGIYNRQYYDDRLLQEQLEAFAIVDIDHLKQINDTYGHLAGDQAIEKLADVLLLCIGSTGDVCRYGGDEFVIAFRKKIPREDFAGRLEQIRSNMHKAKLADFPEASLTVSIGGCHCPGITGNLFRSADNLLYEAKKQRDVVVTDL